MAGEMKYLITLGILYESACAGHERKRARGGGEEGGRVDLYNVRRAYVSFHGRERSISGLMVDARGCGGNAINKYTHTHTHTDLIRPSN